ATLAHRRPGHPTRPIGGFVAPLRTFLGKRPDQGLLSDHGQPDRITADPSSRSTAPTRRSIRDRLLATCSHRPASIRHRLTASRNPLTPRETGIRTDSGGWTRMGIAGLGKFWTSTADACHDVGARHVFHGGLPCLSALPNSPWN